MLLLKFVTLYLLIFKLYNPRFQKSLTKMQARFHLFCFALLSLLIKVCPAQSQEAVFNRLAPPEDISWGNVRGITQDTRDMCGLLLCDQNRMKVYCSRTGKNLLDIGVKNYKQILMHLIFN